MQIWEWGNSLAVQSPSTLCQQLKLFKTGDDIALIATTDERVFEVVPYKSSAQILSELREFRGRLKAHDRLTREDANDRSIY